MTMTVAELIAKLQLIENQKLPVYAYNESGYMKPIKHSPITVTVRKTIKYEPINLILISPDKP